MSEHIEKRDVSLAVAALVITVLPGPRKTEIIPYLQLVMSEKFCPNTKAETTVKALNAKVFKIVG